MFMPWDLYTLKLVAKTKILVMLSIAIFCCWCVIATGQTCAGVLYWSDWWWHHSCLGNNHWAKQGFLAFSWWMWSYHHWHIENDKCEFPLIMYTNTGDLYRETIFLSKVYSRRASEKETGCVGERLSLRCTEKRTLCPCVCSWRMA